MPEPTARESGADTYLDTLDRMEPNIACVDLAAAGASIAISLKRIADSLEKLVGIAGSEDDAPDGRPAVDRDTILAALHPFANFADPRHLVPADHLITAGSPLARQQLRMGDCYTAARVFADLTQPPPPSRDD